MNLFVISAKNRKVLMTYIRDWIEWLTHEELLPACDDVEYTLTECRSHFEERFCLLFASLEELLSTLKLFGSGEKQAEECLSYVKGRSDVISWFNGGEIQSHVQGKKVSLPTYPFDLKTSWHSHPVKESFFAVPKWKETSLTADLEVSDRICQVFSPNSSISTLQLPPNEKENFKHNFIQAFSYIKSCVSKPGKSKEDVLFVLDLNQKVWNAPIIALAKTSTLEKHGFRAKVIEVESLMHFSQDRLKPLLENERKSSGIHVRYTSDLQKRFEVSYDVFEELKPDIDVSLVKSGGVYWICGGGGGIGKLLAQYISRKGIDCTLIITGRSSRNSLELSSPTCKVVYVPCDVTDGNQVEGFVSKTLQDYGQLDGIFHAAGTIRDKRITKKSVDEVDEVFSPKIDGLLNIDRSTREVNLDYIFLFSSDSSLFGNMGQSDYAAANAFMDAYAFSRNELVQKGERKGVTRVINWPLWKDGGMEMSREMEEYLEKTTGIRPIKSIYALSAIENILQSHIVQAFVVEGDRKKIEEKVLNGAIK